MTNSITAVLGILVLLSSAVFFELNSALQEWFSIPTEISTDITFQLMYILLFVGVYILATGKILKGILISIPLSLAVIFGPVTQFHFDLSSTIVAVMTLFAVILSVGTFFYVAD